MANEVGSKLYLQGPRSDRIAPDRSSRVYCHLILLFSKMKQIVLSDALPPGENLLDYGCADKPYETLLKQKFVNHIGADLPGNKRADIEITPGGELPSADGSFDCVLSSQVLEHVTDPKLYLREAFRVLKTGGSLIVSTHGIWPYHPDPTDFWRWTIDGLQREIQLAGFEISLVKSVFGLESVALQLWQDATYERLPSFIRPMYIWFFQRGIQFIEGRQPNKISNDASIYIVLARKPDTH